MVSFDCRSPAHHQSDRFPLLWKQTLLHAVLSQVSYKGLGPLVHTGKVLHRHSAWPNTYRSLIFQLLRSHSQASQEAD